MRSFAPFALLTLPFLSAAAGTVSIGGGGSLLYLGSYGLGQRVVTPSGGPWTNIGFCFLSPGGDQSPEQRCVADFANDPRYPDQPGRLFVLTQEYLGTMGGLSPGTPGFHGVSDILVDSRWVFDSAVTLLPDTAYYFYSDSIPRGVGVEPAGPGGFATFGGDNDPSLVCPESLGCIFQPHAQNNYHLTGDPVPEPVSGLLAAAGLALLGVTRRRRAPR